MNINFIDWFSFKGIAVDESMSLADYCAQYAAVQTNWVYTLSAIFGIIILLIKRNKKAYWYVFLGIVAVMSFTSVGMHTADYGEFERYKLTTKLIMSFVDMTFTELMAWSGVCCFALELYDKTSKKRNALLIFETVFAVIVIGKLAYDVFVVHDRPLYFSPVENASMDGKTGGLSAAELGCFITALPLLYILFDSFKKMQSSEKSLLILIVLTFITAFIITSLWGDNEINKYALGNFHGHSLWHILTGLGTLEAVFWVDQRTSNQKLAALEKKLSKAG